MDFKPFDTRFYPTLSVADGYAEWAATYDDAVQDEMDIRLLERLETVPWAKIDSAIDLACGTGRLAVWLKRRGVARLEGVDLSDEMMAQARAKQVYAVLHRADVRDTGLPAGDFDLAVMGLAECHLDDLRPFYTEAARLLAAGGHLVLIGYHPHFLLKGVPTHFDRPDGSSIAIQDHINLFSDHTEAAFAAGFALTEMTDGLIDDDWVAKHPRYAKHRNQPVSFCMVWRKGA